MTAIFHLLLRSGLLASNMTLPHFTFDGLYSIGITSTSDMLFSLLIATASLKWCHRRQCHHEQPSVSTNRVQHHVAEQRSRASRRAAELAEFRSSRRRFRFGAAA
jgi:hypothetical protein